MLQNEDIFRTFNKPKINEEIKLQELITKIDKAIERLEGTEEIEEIEELKEIEKLMELDMQEMIDEEDIPDSYDIILYRCNSCENVIALVVAKILDVSYNEAVNKLKEEPQIFKFETRIEERAKADIRNVWVGMFIIYSINNNKDNCIKEGMVYEWLTIGEYELARREKEWLRLIEEETAKIKRGYRQIQVMFG